MRIDMRRNALRLLRPTRADGARPCVGVCGDLASDLGITMSNEYKPGFPAMRGAHWYNDLPVIDTAIVRVSKVHDFFNSWSYNNVGNYVGTSYLGNTLFQLYSFAGMPVAAVYTFAAHLDAATLTAKPSRRERE